MFDPNDAEIVLERLASLVAVSQEALGLLDGNLERAQAALRPLCDPNLEMTLAAQSSLAVIAMAAVGEARMAVRHLRTADEVVKTLNKTTLH